MKGYFAAGIYAILLCASGATLAATVTVKGNVIEPTCSITGQSGETIEVPFGDEVLTTRIDGKKYDIQRVAYKLQCEDGMTDGAALQISISGTEASFGDGLLNTSVTGLGVQFLTNNAASPLPLNTGEAKFNYNVSGLPDIWAVLARDPSVTLPSGAFTATAMMSVDYQ